uniref:Uncharacterized protein n=1 Tax=Rhizophora mucronata TaxID=61149 RepID=A0A2P2NRD4_RHIMU
MNQVNAYIHQRDHRIVVSLSNTSEHSIQV